MNPWTTHAITTVYDNPWIAVTHREVTTPGGHPGIYGMVHFKNLAIGIVPLDEEQHIWLVGQFRYPLNQYSWEIPEGGCPLGTAPLDSAKRELREETGMEAREWTKILDMHLSNSVSDEAAVVYLAQGLSFGEPEPEETESLQLRRVSLETALNMIDSGEITDSISVAALLKVGRIFKKG